MRNQQEIEKIVLDAMQYILEDPSLDEEANFFEAGGNSLLAALLIERLEKQINGNLRVRTVLQNPTARSLAVTLVASLP